MVLILKKGTNMKKLLITALIGLFSVASQCGNISSNGRTYHCNGPIFMEGGIQQCNGETTINGRVFCNGLDVTQEAINALNANQATQTNNPRIQYVSSGQEATQTNYFNFAQSNESNDNIKKNKKSSVSKNHTTQTNHFYFGGLTINGISIKCDGFITKQNGQYFCINEDRGITRDITEEVKKAKSTKKNS